MMPASTVPSDEIDGEDPRFATNALSPSHCDADTAGPPTADANSGSPKSDTAKQSSSTVVKEVSSPIHGPASVDTDRSSATYEPPSTGEECSSASYVPSHVGKEQSSATYVPSKPVHKDQSKKPLTLRAAVKACDAEAVEQALMKLGDNREAALDATDGSGRTLLHLCAAAAVHPQTTSVLKLLIDHKARPDVRNAVSQTPMSVAVAAAGSANDIVEASSASRSVQLLLDARALPTGQQDLEQQLSAKSKEVQGELRRLLGLLSDLETSEKTTTEAAEELPADLPGALLVAVDCHDVTVVRRIFEKLSKDDAADVSSADLAEAFDVDGNTLLHRCAVGASLNAESSKNNVYEPTQENGADIADILIHAKADVNSTNLLGETPLLAAARTSGNTHIGVVHALLTAGANPNCADAFAGETALMEAACRGETVLCQMLLEHRADISRENCHGRTARDMALENRHTEVLSCLITHANSQSPGPDDESTVPSELLSAVQSCDVESVGVLLAAIRGSSAQHLPSKGVDQSGSSLLHIVAARGQHEGAADVARLLLEHKVPVDAKDLSGETPLSLAVFAALDCTDNWAALDTVRVLLVAGADANAGVQSLQKAVEVPGLEGADSDEQGRLDVCRLLQAFGAEFSGTASDSHSAHDNTTGGEGDQSLEARCADEDLPLDKLGPVRAKAVLGECDRWREMSVKQLRASCVAEGIPTDGCVEKIEIISRLRQLRVWQALPLAALKEECRIKGVARPESTTREELEDALLVVVYQGLSRHERVKEQCKAKGITVDKLSSLDKAEVLLQQVARMEGLSIGELKREFNRRGLTVEAGTEKNDMLKTIRDVLLWDELTLEGLLLVCRERGLAGPAATTREELLKRLATSIGQTQMTESRFKNFFSYGKEPSKEESKQPGASKDQSRSTGTTSSSSPPGDENERAWESRADQNRRQFAQGNRNHAGMPGGQRRFAGPGGPTVNPGGAGGGGYQQRPAAPKPPSVDKYFRSLGLPVSASHDDVRKAYRKLALQYHPDKNPGQKKLAAEAKFQEISEAYDKLCEHLRTRK